MVLIKRINARVDAVAAAAQNNNLNPGSIWRNTGKTNPARQGPFNRLPVRTAIIARRARTQRSNCFTGLEGCSDIDILSPGVIETTKLKLYFLGVKWGSDRLSASFFAPGVGLTVTQVSKVFTGKSNDRRTPTSWF